MKILFLTFTLLVSLTITGQKRIGLLCTNFKVNNDLRLDGESYRKSLESVLSNLKNPPLIIDRDNIPELLIRIQEEANLNKDLKTAIPVLKAANVDYIMYSNFDKKVVYDFYDLQMEIVKISGDNTFSKKIFPILRFSEKELANTDTFRNKLNKLLNTYAFTDDFGIIENEQLEKIYKRLDEKDIEIDSLKTGIKNIKDEINEKGKTISSLGEVLSRIQIENGQKEHEIKRLNNEVSEIRDYSNIAELDLFGLKQRFDDRDFGGWHTELYDMMRQVISNKNNSIQFNPSDSAIAILESIIQKYPKFPFSYWAKATILLKRNNADWLKNAQQAMKILAITITIEGHKKEHDMAFKVLEKMFESYAKGSKIILDDALFQYSK